jgi:protein subunit release factor B
MSKRKELLFSVSKKDLDVQFFRAGGKGGQHQNKTSSACRIKHLASGAVGECRNHRSQAQNKAEAFRRLCGSQKFKAWVRFQSACKQKERIDVERWLDKQLAPHNLRVETSE